MDNVQGAVNYDYCHLYGNYLATAIAVDVGGAPGPTAGTHNIAAATPPWIRTWKRWPAYTTVTYDDPGLVMYSDSYVNRLLPVMAAKGIPLSIAVVTGGTYSQSIISEVQNWINAGWDINTHSVSHQYWNPPSTTACDDVNGPIPCDAFLLAYVGPGTYTMSITHGGGGGNLTLTATPYNATCYHSWDLTPVPPGGTPGAGQIDTLANIVPTLQAQPNCYAVDATAYNNQFAKGRSHAFSLANTFSSAGVPGPMTLPGRVPIASSCTASASTPGCVLFDETNLETDEMSWGYTWFSQNLPGLAGLNLSNLLYVMPGTYGDAVTENIANGLGFKGVRGTGSLSSTWVLGGADATLAKGYDVFNILSQGVVPNYQKLSYEQMRNLVSQDVFKNALWMRWCRAGQRWSRIRR
jgi:Polysaccharide deacetylase